MNTNSSNTRLFLLPTLCLGGAALLLAPARPSEAFRKIGGSLSETQRDVRVFDNFLDTQADDNATPASQFPGWTGLELALWKGIVEWGSTLHGDGSGDINGNTLGNGGANFDAFWSGNANGIGGTNDNVVSSQATCGGGGTLAFTETPISDGWRIRFCDEWTWNDGPAGIGLNFDLQGVMAHEYGHALGLGHSSNSGATMAPSTGAGSTVNRSITTDDVLGIQCVYGIASATKPVITATSASGNTLTIFGSQFSATGNEVWFAHTGTTTPTSDPIVRVANVNSTSGGTVIAVAIPALAAPGDVIVNKPGSGGATLSNAFPTDLVGTFGVPPGPHPNISNVSPSKIDALIPGTAQTITVSGTDLDTTTSLRIDGSPIPSARWTIVDASTITLDMPQVAALGAHDISATDGVITDTFGVTVVANATPTYELGTGDPQNVIDKDVGMSWILAGTPGRHHRVYASLSNVPSNNASFTLEIGNNFTNLYDAGTYTIPASGWLQVDVPPSLLPDPGPSGAVFYSQSVDIHLPRPFIDSNLQSILLVQ